jgi:hypothetical protein
MQQTHAHHLILTRHHTHTFPFQRNPTQAGKASNPINPMAEAAAVGDHEAARAVVESDEQSATLKLAQATTTTGDGGNGAGAGGEAALDGSQASGEGGMSKRQMKKAAKGMLKDKKDKKPP